MVDKVTMCVRMKPSYFNSLNIIADSKEMSKSELVRHILENYVDLHA